MHQPSILMQSSQYIEEQSKPIKFLEFSNQPFLDQSNFNTYRQSEVLERLNQAQKKNPYRLSWANLNLHKHYSIEIVESGYRIRIKKLQATEGTSILNINISFTSHIGIKIKREKAISYQCYSLFQKQFRKILQTKRKYHMSTLIENYSSNRQNSLSKQTEENDVLSQIQVKS